MLAGIVAIETTTGHWRDDAPPSCTPAASCRVQVVAIGYGTRCLGHAARSTTGWLLHDEHAEVICRRALQR